MKANQLTPEDRGSLERIALRQENERIEKALRSLDLDPDLIGHAENRREPAAQNNHRKEFELVPTEAEIVRMIYERYHNKGWGYKRIANYRQAHPNAPQIRANAQGSRKACQNSEAMSARLGAAAASLLITRRGAPGQMPTRAELAALGAAV